MRILWIAAVLILFFGAQAKASGVLGDWVTPGTAAVRVYPCGANICLRLIRLDPKLPATKDIYNPETPLRTRPLCGLDIGFGFHAGQGDSASGGKLYDPQSGRTYSGKMVAQGNILKLRGYFLIPLFGRTEIWHRSPQTVQPCG
jgi:uncharacterized protein (DUF2147 family)